MEKIIRMNRIEGCGVGLCSRVDEDGTKGMRSWRAPKERRKNLHRTKRLAGKNRRGRSAMRLAIEKSGGWENYGRRPEKTTGE